MSAMPVDLENTPNETFTISTNRRHLQQARGMVDCDVLEGNLPRAFSGRAGGLTMHHRKGVRAGLTATLLLACSVGALAQCMARAADAAGSADADHSLIPFTPCPHCKLLLGIGATWAFWGWSDGFVIPVTLEIDDSRWEVGAFRMARTQIVVGEGPPDKVAAYPYWGFSAMRRWQFLHRPWGRLYFGFGAVYRTETDYLDPTRWDFSYMLGIRFDLGHSGSVLEVADRHWSDAWIKRPNRGQDFLTLSVSF